MADATWEPVTSLQRLGHSENRELFPESKVERARVNTIEGAILRSFRNRAAKALPSDSGTLEWLSLAQHHGCPTRLLDFSQSPLVALYFATADASSDEKDGVIWCVYPRNCFKESECFSKYETYSKWSGEEWWFVARFDQIQKFVMHMCNSSGNKHTNDLDRLESLGDSLLFVETADSHPRVKAQQHIFAVATQSNRSIGDFLREKQADVDENGQKACIDRSTYDSNLLYRRIILPANKKKEFRGKLRLLGVNQSTIMPDHDGLGQWLTEYYRAEQID